MNNNGGSKNNGNFLNGLLWGAVVGGGLVFLLGTKKGKKILKIITEEGLEGISEIGDLIEEIEEEKEIEEIPKTNGHARVIEQNVEHATTPKTARRLFKGVPRR